MLAEFSVAPLSEGVSLSRYVARLIEIIEDSRLEHETHAMATIIEGEWDAVMACIKKCHMEMCKHSDRVLTAIRIDDRKGAHGRIRGKIRSLEQQLGRKIR